MSEAPEKVLAVTMTPEAALRFKAALTWATAQVSLTDPPVSDRQRTEYEHAEWLRWGIGRVQIAERESS